MERPIITTLLDLLHALHINIFHGRKTDAYVVSYRQGAAEVREHFDDGKGHSGAFTCDMTPLDWTVFTEARDARYITGVLEPGRVSTTKFKLSEQGERELSRLLEEAAATHIAAAAESGAE